jgi:hypothetical protein
MKSEDAAEKISNARQVDPSGPWTAILGTGALRVEFVIWSRLLLQPWNERWIGSAHREQFWKGQEAHHRKMTFQEEFLALLKKHRYDPRSMTFSRPFGT